MTDDRQLDLFPTALEDALSLHNQQPGFFAILEDGLGGKRQKSYRVEHMQRVIAALDPSIDTFMSQASFFRRNRRAVNLWHLPLCFVDIDYHQTEHGRVPPDYLAFVVRQFLADEGMPPASIYVSSGRGLYVKWFLDPALPQAALPRWNAVQRVLVDRLARFGADPHAKDCSRVLRLIQTVNTKVADPERRKVRVVHVEERDGAPLRHGFDWFADEVLPFSRQQIRDLQDERAAAKAVRDAECQPNASRELAAARFTQATLRHGRFMDLRRVIAKRGVIDEGMRERALFVMLNEALGSGVIVPAMAHHEARALAHEINPNFREGSEWSQSDLTSVIARGRLQYAAARVGISAPEQLYRFKTDTLINWFKITPDEMRDLDVLIDTSEKYRRKNLKRYGDVAKTRAERRDKVRRLHAWGWSLRKIAAHLGCNQQTVANDLKSTG